MTRAVNGVLKAGLTPTRINLDRKRHIVVHCGLGHQEEENLSEYVGPTVILE